MIRRCWVSNLDCSTIIAKGRRRYLFRDGITFVLCLAFTNYSPAAPENLSLLNNHLPHPKPSASLRLEHLCNSALFWSKAGSVPNNIGGQALPGKTLFHTLPNNLRLHPRSISELDRGSPAFPQGRFEWFRSRSYLTLIDSFSHKRTACFEIVLLCVHNNLCTARMRLYRLIQMASVWKNRTRKFHSVPKVTQTFVFFICWPNRRRC